MLIRELSLSEKDSYNKIATHPLQSWQWGAFRENTGIVVKRFGVFNDNRLTSGFQVFFHSLPKTSSTIGYVPRGPIIDNNILSVLKDIGDKHHSIFIKLEPNVLINNPSLLKSLKAEQFSPKNFISQFENLKISKRPLFTKYTFQIDLTKSEDELLSQMKEKTRYNVRLSEKKGVKIQEDNSKDAFKKYLELTKETVKRQKFFAHNEKYHQNMWNILQPEGIAHLLTARFQNEIIVTWIVLLFNNRLYYPYGASSTSHRNVMASNLMMWEAIKWGKKHGAKIFDLWGALGANPDPKHEWYGFHRFKEGFGGELVEFIGSYDFVLKKPLYPLYNLAEKIRWAYLKGTTLLWLVPELW